VKVGKIYPILSRQLYNLVWESFKAKREEFTQSLNDSRAETATKVKRINAFEVLVKVNGRQNQGLR